jgi:diacylglycerol kinase (ATP)
MMNLMKLRFIFNPRSGRPRRNAPLLPLVRDFIANRNLDADLVMTEGPGHATELAKEAVSMGCERVVAVGGDGTMNEVAQALLGHPTALALVPCGSGNGLALHLGLPRTFAGVLDLAAATASRVAELDTGSVNGLPFFNAMGIGLDAEVSRRFNHLARRGLPAYARTALAAFLKRRTERCYITAGDRREPIDALLIAVANSDQYGNRARIAPGARVDDGVLDLIAVRAVGIPAAINLGFKLFWGTFDRSASVRRFRGSRFRIERPEPGIIHTDGETHSTGAVVDVVVRPRSLRVVVPLDSPALPAQDPTAAGFALQLP